LEEKVNTEAGEKGGSISCATSCEPCGNAEMLFPTEDEREIDRLRGQVAERQRRIERALVEARWLRARLESHSRDYATTRCAETLVEILEGRP
jgi:molecular chaperone GrpE (heat shock protein)